MKLMVLHAGGTIGMSATSEGLAPKLGLVEDFLAAQAVSGKIASDFDLLVADPLIDSANAKVEDWNWIADQIAAQLDEYDGFVVSHGTDTLAFSASALSYALENLPKPVVFTGSMLPLSVPDNDGAANLTFAFNTVSRALPGVWLAFNGKLLHGCRIQKRHSLDLDAFAELQSAHPIPATSGPFVQHRFHSVDIPVLTVTPATSCEHLYRAAETADALILRCYGSGTVPKMAGVNRALIVASERQIPAVVISQCIEGGVELSAYATGNDLLRLGVIDGKAATYEAIFTKLCLALSRFESLDEQRAYLSQNICGEF